MKKNKTTPGRIEPGKQTVNNTDIQKQDRSEFPFDKENYKWLLIGLAFLLVGFILMIGGGSDDPDVFNYGMFNFQRLTLAPVLLFTGYLIGIYAILKKPKKTHN
jgi:hypothetical protein